VHVSLQGLVVLEDTRVKAVARHGVVVAAQGVASLERCILSGSGAFGWYGAIQICGCPAVSLPSLAERNSLLCAL
jgi:hypothetical protein